jgi:antitoxin component of RelBE/YafQ-DinJ toxin-antitoxin module
MKDKSVCGGRYAAQVWLTLRVTQEEKKRLTELAAQVGLSISEYARRKFFGGRPLIPRTDALALSELRRLGGLLKHNFATIRLMCGSETTLRIQEDVLRQIARQIENMGKANDDRQENQNQENGETQSPANH